MSATSAKMQSSLNRQGYTWGRSTLNTLNLLINIAILGIIIYLAVHLNHVVNNIIQTIIKNVNKNKPQIIETGSDIATGVLKNDDVKSAIENIVSSGTKSIKEEINKIIPKNNIPGSVPGPGNTDPTDPTDPAVPTSI